MFKDDLKSWKRIEREFASRLMKRDVSKIEFSEWKFPDRDVKATFHKQGQIYEKTFEIKEDRVAERTGNVWIEYMCNGKPSGIYTSKADIIVYKLWDEFRYVDRAKLLVELCTCVKENVFGWDNNSSQLFLLKREVFNLLTTEL